MITGCKTIAQKYFSQFRPEKNPVFNKKHFQILKNLVNDKSIRITSPDKGRGICVLNAQDYHDKLNVILLDNSKFSPCYENDENLGDLLSGAKSSLTEGPPSTLYEKNAFEKDAFTIKYAFLSVKRQTF